MPPKVVLPQPLQRASYVILYSGGSTLPFIYANRNRAFLVFAYNKNEGRTQKMTEELMKKNLEGKEQVIFMENVPYLIILVNCCAQKERSLWKAVKCITVYLHAIGIESRTTNILPLLLMFQRDLRLGWTEKWRMGI